MIQNIPSLANVIDNPVPILSIIFMMSLMLSTIFMNVYDSVSFTIMQCLWVDIDICNSNQDDNPNRPREMDQIMDILRK